MYTTIVVALDGSESSDRALPVAAELARTDGARIIGVHVVELMLGRATGYPVHADEDELRAKVEGQIAALRESGLDAMLEVTAVTLGGPAHVIADAASHHGADLIVAGTRGLSRIGGLILGSVTQRLLHVAPCPVLVVPENAETGRREDAAAVATAG